MEEFWCLFEQAYQCYPPSQTSRPTPEIFPEFGNKILMPASALDLLLQQPINFPMMFSLHNPRTGQVSHCGVLEFTAEEGSIVMPDWTMENMKLQEGELAVLRDASLQKGTYVKIQPHSVAFVELPNPKAILEISLRSHACLTTGDTIMIIFNNKRFYIDVVETKPSRAISIIDTDCEVDFATPLDYKEPDKEKLSDIESKASDVKISDLKIQEDKSVPFVGNAKRLDGKPSKAPLVKGSGSETESHGSRRKVSSGTSLVFGSKSSTVKPLKEDRKIQEEQTSKKEEKRFQPFTGKCYKLIG